MQNPDWSYHSIAWLSSCQSSLLRLPL
jgi:hypothetical protein